jgi:hypothetical protein
MPAEDTLKKLLETVTRELDEARAEFNRVLQAERTDAAAAARESADADRARAIADAEAAAEERGRAAGRDAGLQEGREEGKKEGAEEGREEGREAGKTEGYETGFAAGREAGREEGMRAGSDAIATSQRLADAIRAIDEARSLSEILDTLVTSAGREAARTALFLVRGPQLHGWRLIGFEGADNHLEVPVADSGLIGDAVGSAATASATSGGAQSLPPFAQLPAGRRVLAVPLQLSGQVIAVLYADAGAAEFDAKPTWPAIVEVLTRYAARCIEATTAFRAAKILTEPQERSSSEASVDDAQAAQRYARLLVSEIKMYHEAEVIAGRRERDLASRLGGEISRARVLYEQRVPTHIRRTGDHFQAELVRTLADGDASLLEVKT